jgi:hypothetical protein
MIDGGQDWEIAPHNLTPDEFYQAILHAFDEGGACEGHMEADKIVFELLMALGYGEGVRVFNAYEKWYS